MPLRIPVYRSIQIVTGNGVSMRGCQETHYNMTLRNYHYFILPILVNKGRPISTHIRAVYTVHKTVAKQKLLVNAVTNGTVSGPRTRTTLESLDIFNDPNSITKVDLYSGAYAVLVHVTRSVASARTQKRQH